jgi:hypothetical protein
MDIEFSPRQALTKGHGASQCSRRAVTACSQSYYFLIAQSIRISVFSCPNHPDFVLSSLNFDDHFLSKRVTSGGRSADFQSDVPQVFNLPGTGISNQSQEQITNGRLPVRKWERGQ